MKKIISTVSAMAIAYSSFGFCGFYVAKADTKLFNKTSQVIIARNGDHSTITMSSDFEGDVKDFAMVVPVPVVLEQKDIKVVDRILFDKLDAYSGPRLVEYYDQDPCYAPRYYDYMVPAMARSNAGAAEDDIVMDSAAKKDYGVTVEAKYTVGEYDILILSAKESGGLYDWLSDNGYKVPDGAKEVLDPYITGGMKFFVAKVNLDNYQNNGAVPLRPLQISFNSPKFMLPIRLGMANADGPQDLIVYAFSKTGRIETTNYRTVPVPTGQNVPLFVADEFGSFYKNLYNKAWKRENQNTVFLEYAWDVSPQVTSYCDPCTGPPPMLDDFQQAGVDWVENYHYGYQGEVHFTRLHITYARNTFPQDLMFEETPNKENFQARYVITHPASSDFSCDAGQDYLKELSKRRWNELWTYQWLTGNAVTDHYDYPAEYNKFLKKENKKTGDFIPPFIPPQGNNGPDGGMMSIVLSFLTLAAVMFTLSRRRQPAAVA
ncbi:MAG TPA: DUF2330 domain-containing protein [Bacteroidia bacterium]|nr:DUF2330 domain-containing protein [Bacteroidia bacterium]